MAGPLLVYVLFGIALLLRGKVQFGNIYGFGLTGCFGIFAIINLLSNKGQYVELYSVISILGYSLLPFCFLAFLSTFLDLSGNYFGTALSVLMVIWSTVTATRFFEYGLGLEDKKFLIGYPIVLFYTVFMLLAMF
uniref:Protein YIPF n=1 Tax=Strombidium inclinatum TaxID=197538 RepID=A0A7S3MY48_9SPIT|mmetsp:Transcript_27409/g.41677  ORF Transcript_27409/g.41677 Transcript_27409/m.41677 type:complete len:135 (+) Transcript_27409:483-887(+)